MDTGLYIVFTTSPEKGYKNEYAFLNDQRYSSVSDSLILLSVFLGCPCCLWN